MPVGIVAEIMGHKPSATAERHYKSRPLELLGIWHTKYLGDFGEDDLAQYKENKADVWDSLAMRAVLSITSKKLEKSSAAQLSIIAGTAFDKSQISRGQATGINVVALLDVVEAIRAQDSGGNRPAQVIEAADVVARF